MMTAYLGYFAGLGTSFAWAFTSVFFTMASRKVGPAVVNRTRLLLAISFAMLAHWAILGTPIPIGAEPFRWGWLAVSGIIGFVIGDAMLFQAFVAIGPRLSMLLMALAPVFSTVLAWVLLRETLAPIELLGIGVTISGVAVVVTDRQNGQNGQNAAGQPPPRYYFTGVLFGLGGSLGQAVGLLASRQGLVDRFHDTPDHIMRLAMAAAGRAPSGEFSALSGNLIRLACAALTIWAITAVQGHVRENFRQLRARPDAAWWLVGGSIAGPFIGVWLSLIAVQKAPLGIASTLMSLAPVLLLPVGRVLFDERIGRRAIAGTVIAITGTTILFL